MVQLPNAELIERADNLVRVQLELLPSLSTDFLAAPSSQAFAELSKAVFRLQAAVKVQTLVRALNLESAAAEIADRWEGGGGGFSGGGASGGW